MRQKLTEIDWFFLLLNFPSFRGLVVFVRRLPPGGGRKREKKTQFSSYESVDLLLASRLKKNKRRVASGAARSSIVPS